MNYFRTVVLCSLAISLFSACGNSSKSGEYGYKELYPNASGITFDDFETVELSADIPLGSVRKIKVEDSLIFISTDESAVQFSNALLPSFSFPSITRDESFELFLKHSLPISILPLI